ncbi:MAG: hypothetical protein ACM31O_22630 [Bacteroidota bacterium]
MASDQNEIDALRGRIQHLEAQSGRPERWHRRLFSTALSVIAVLFSLASTGFAYLGTYQRNIQDAQTQLRSLIVYMNDAAKRNIDILRSASYNAAEKSAFSAALNKENLVYAAQAERVVGYLTSPHIETLFGQQISASELSNIANNFYNSSLTDKSLDFYRMAVRYSRNYSEYSDAQRGYALLLASQQPAGIASMDWRGTWRGEFQKALAVFDHYPAPNQFTQVYIQALTELAWATAEMGVGDCGQAQAHVLRAKAQADQQHPGAKDNPLWMTFVQQLEQANLQVSSACLRR